MAFMQGLFKLCYNMSILHLFVRQIACCATFPVHALRIKKDRLLGQT